MPPTRTTRRRDLGKSVRNTPSSVTYQGSMETGFSKHKYLRYSIKLLYPVLAVALETSLRIEQDHEKFKEG